MGDLAGHHVDLVGKRGGDDHVGIARAGAVQHVGIGGEPPSDPAHPACPSPDARDRGCCRPPSRRSFRRKDGARSASRPWPAPQMMTFMTLLSLQAQGLLTGTGDPQAVNPSRKPALRALRFIFPQIRMATGLPRARPTGQGAPGKPPGAHRIFQNPCRAAPAARGRLNSPLRPPSGAPTSRHSARPARGARHGSRARRSRRPAAR